MKYVYVLLMGIFLALAFQGCGDNHNRSDVWANIDLSKKGVVYEDDVVLQDDIFYRFLLGYIQNDELRLKEWEQVNKLYKGGERYKHISVFKIMGMGGWSPKTGKAWMDFEGSKIVLKFTLTPFKKMPHDYLYVRGDDSHNTTLKYSKEKSFEITMDLSKYSYIYHTRAKDNKEDTVYGKRICEIGLPKGKYHIKVESLYDVPEIKEIRTAFIIEPARYGKGF